MNHWPNLPTLVHFLSGPAELDCLNRRKTLETGSQNKYVHKDALMSRHSVASQQDLDTKVYEERIDIEALRQYVRTRFEPQAEELLRAAEQAPFYSLTVRSLPMTYRHNVYTGRRVADTASLQRVTHACRVACGLQRTIFLGRNTVPIVMMALSASWLRHVGRPCNFSLLSHYVTTPLSIINEVMQHYDVSHAEATNLLQSILYGGTVQQWRLAAGVATEDLTQILAFEKEAAEAAKTIMDSRPDVCSRFKVKRCYDCGAERDECVRATLAYILAEAEDKVLRECEMRLEKEGILVRAVLSDGLLVEEGSDVRLALALEEAARDVRKSLGFPIYFEHIAQVAAPVRAAPLQENIIPRTRGVQESDGWKRRRVEKPERSVCGETERPIATETKRASETVKNSAWTLQEKRRFSQAMRYLDISNRTFWTSLSTTVGRSPRACKEYYNCSKLPIRVKKSRRSDVPAQLPTTDCPLRIKRIRERLQSRRCPPKARPNITLDFPPGEISLSPDVIEDIAHLSSGLTASQDPTNASQSCELSQQSDISDEAGLFQYLHLATKKLRRTSSPGKPRLAPYNIGSRVSSLLPLLRDVDQEERAAEEHSDGASDMHTQESITL